MLFEDDDCVSSPMSWHACYVHLWGCVLLEFRILLTVEQQDLPLKAITAMRRSESYARAARHEVDTRQPSGNNIIVNQLHLPYRKIVLRTDNLSSELLSDCPVGFEFADRPSIREPCIRLPQSGPHDRPLRHRRLKPCISYILYHLCFAFYH